MSSIGEITIAIRLGWDVRANVNRIRWREIGC